MKKLSIAVALVLFGVGVGYCVPLQPQNIGSVKADVFVIPTATVAQMNALIPDATGQLLHVSDAVQGRVCVSTGAAAPSVTGAWVLGVATGTFVGNSYPHCQ